jgi:protein-S-isoprenylcysteine O-methyltransferase Ste14
MFLIPVFPIYIPGMEKLFPYGTLIWLGGVVLLWLTRHTHQLGRRWGKLYYGISMVIRPLGVLAIAAGWMALMTPYGAGRTAYVNLWATGTWAEIVNWAALLLFFGFGLWSVFALGLRRSFLFRRVDDKLVTRGPYGLVRHPQFLSAIGLTLFSFLIHSEYPMSYFGPQYANLGLNWALFTLALWVLSILEERELLSHFGEEYRDYMRRVPRIFPN